MEYWGEAVNKVFFNTNYVPGYCTGCWHRKLSISLWNFLCNSGFLVVNNETNWCSFFLKGSYWYGQGEFASLNGEREAESKRYFPLLRFLYGKWIISQKTILSKSFPKYKFNVCQRHIFPNVSYLTSNTKKLTKQNINTYLNKSS